MLHGFVTDLAKRVEGIPDEDGLLQCIRPAQERLRRALRITAPDFRPFEKRYAETKKLGRAEFLLHEEGHEEIGPSDVYESEARSDSSASMDRVGYSSGPIYIDEVMGRAHQ